MIEQKRQAVGEGLPQMAAAEVAPLGVVDFTYTVAECRSYPGAWCVLRQTPGDRPVSILGTRSRFGAIRHCIRQIRAWQRAGFTAQFLAEGRA
jgi:hypothetical protein